MIEDEHGPDCDDKINIVVRGGNYGWIAGEGCPAYAPGSIAAIRTYTPCIAPSGAVWYTSTAIPQWTQSYLFTSLRGEAIRRLTISPGPNGTVTGEDVLYEETYGRIRSIQQAPDGSLWFTTDNGSDSIYRIRPTS
jgi:glucose/arabinose dehydrogenase